MKKDAAIGRNRARQSRRLFGIFMAVALATVVLSLFCPLARADGYSFEVPSENVLVRINSDSSLDVNYSVEFANDSGAKAIDVVDIGMPTDAYVLDECSASIDGVELADIRKSGVVSPGVEVHLVGQAIEPGEKKRLDFHGRVPNMVFTNSERTGYASVLFGNTWWDPAYAHGFTNLTVSIQFPPGVKSNETIYYGQERPSASSADGAIVFTWTNKSASPSEGYEYGVSFPAVYVSGVSPEQPLPDYEPVSPSGTSSYSSGWLSWRYLFYILPVVIMFLVRMIVGVSRVRSQGGKVSYITPKVGMEGAGPRTDLTPAEAAVLLNLDLDRITAIAYFEMVPTGIVSIQGVKPLTLARTKSIPENVPDHYALFLGAISDAGGVERQGLKLALTALIKSVEKKMQGHSHAQTANYYNDRSAKAWIEVKSTADHGRRVDKLNGNLPVMLLDEGFVTKMKETFSAGSFPLPVWAAGLARVSGGEGTEVQIKGGELSVPGQALAGAISTAFLGIQDATFADVQELQGEIVREVNPMEYRRVYRPYWGAHYGRSGGWGGGTGCACACACAGCACACAGGGR